jgi:tRNA threonylcarbamoyladenosine biosynthesis protein TsaE
MTRGELPSLSRCGSLVTGRVISQSAEATQRIASRMAVHLAAGDRILLLGTLGAGKTCFVQGLAQGLGVDRNHKVTSPTFTLLCVYRGRLPLYHLDAYRISDPAELMQWSDEALLADDGIVAVEWGEGLKRLLPGPILVIRFRIRGNQERLIRFYGPWSRFGPLAADFLGQE